MSRILIATRESRSPRRSVRRGTLANSTPPHARGVPRKYRSILDSLHPRKIFFAHRVIRSGGSAVGSPVEQAPAAFAPQRSIENEIVCKNDMHRAQRYKNS